MRSLKYLAKWQEDSIFVLMKRFSLLLIVLIACATAHGQKVSLIGDYSYRSEKKEGDWKLNLKPDSTYKWYFTESKESHHGHWKCGNEEITLFEDSAAKDAKVKFKVLEAEDSERPVLLYRKKCFYFKQ